MQLLHADIGNLFRGVEQGQKQQIRGLRLAQALKQQELQKQIGQKVASGGLQEASRFALQAGDYKTAFALEDRHKAAIDAASETEREEGRRMAEDIYISLQGARTPMERQSIMNGLSQKYGDDINRYRNPLGSWNDQRAMAEALGIKEYVDHLQKEKKFTADQSYRSSQLALGRERNAIARDKASRSDGLINMVNPKTNDVVSVVKGSPEAMRLSQGGYILAGSRSLSKGLSVSVGPDGTVQFEQGGPASQATKSTTNKLQQDIVDGGIRLRKLDRIQQQYRPEFFTYKGAAKAHLESFDSKLTGNTKQPFLKSRTKFFNSIRQETNAYRKEITGAAAAAQELKRIEQSMININQSPAEFEAAFEQYKFMVKETQEIKQQMLREGIPLKSPAFGKVLDKRLMQSIGEFQSGQNSTYPDGTMIENKTTGQKMIMRGGKWEAIQ